MLYQDTVILVFAKAPIEGKVNTRLIPDIGVHAATQLQFDLLHQRLSMLFAAELCEVRLMCAPDTSHVCFTSCAGQYGVSLLKQKGDNLGQRMHQAVAQALQQYRYCVVVGTDAPALDSVQINQVIEKLHEGTAVVFIPAEDGGYVLIGVDQVYDCLFNDIDWGTERVMQQSRDQLKKNIISYEELSVCWDIDRFADYQRYLAMK